MGSVQSEVFYVFDERGNAVLRLDKNANVLSEHKYQAYGKETTTRTAASGAASDPWGFGAQYGYYTDHETGFVYCTFRYYDPNTGRWLSQDPIGLGGGQQNLYAYCGGDPVNENDPLGLQKIQTGPPYFNDPSGETWVNPKNLRVGDKVLFTDRVNNSYRLNTTGNKPPPIIISSEGVIDAGRSRAFVAAHFNEPIQVIVKGSLSAEGTVLITEAAFDKGLPNFLRPSLGTRVGQWVRGFFGRLFTSGRSSGSGGGPAAIVTVGVGAGALADGARATMPYAQTHKRMMKDLQCDPEHGEIPAQVYWKK